ncbi:Ornithine decarboxylase [Aphelenchoides besseyi]|nr:Ornithine decarboxylase [Aphelenchoides besseyi]KAI6208035.1 Ornithine decarboxylase [Aphelenchoides besseyi]
MSVRMVPLGNTLVTVCKNQRTAFDFTQDLALSKSQQGDSKSFFVADLGKIEAALIHWKNCLPRVRPFYSLNCNNNPALLQILAAVPQVGLHCVTRQNVENALDFVSPNRIFYSNPCWTKLALRQTQKMDIGLLSFDSEEDLTRMANSNVTARLILNITLNSSSTDSSATLGCDLTDAASLLTTAANYGLNCVGIGFTLGSDVCRAASYEQAIEIASQLFVVGSSLGFHMNVLNLGGGFPSPYSSGFALFESICSQINSALNYYFPSEHCDELQIIATPGRFFAASIFSLVTNIVEKSEVDASAITNDDFDAGQRGFVYRINEGYYGPFGCRSVDNCDPKCSPLFESDVNVATKDLFYGSVMGPDFGDSRFDTVQPQCHFRQMSEGEWLFWENLGAYSMNNCEMLDDTDGGCLQPQIFYFANEMAWKNINPNAFADEYTFDVQSDEENDSAIGSEIDFDPYWLLMDDD